MTKKPTASVTMPICPHCQEAAGTRKQAGSYHCFEHDGQAVRLFHVRCKGCDGSFTLREIWPITPESVGNQTVSDVKLST